MNDINQITEQLEVFPQQIHQASEKTERLREIWLLSEARKDYETAQAFLEAKAGNLTEGQAKARAIESVYATTMDVIRAESVFRRAVADQTRLENQFAAVRKRANLIEAQIQRFGGHAA